MVAQSGQLAFLIRQLLGVTLHLLLLAAHAVEAGDILANPILIVDEVADIGVRAAALGVCRGDLILQGRDLLQLLARRVAQGLVADVNHQNIRRHTGDGDCVVVDALLRHGKLLRRAGGEFHFEAAYADAVFSDGFRSMS